MSLAAILNDITTRRKTVVVYASDDTGADLADALTTRNLTVDHRKVPSIGAESFVIIRDDGEFEGVISLADLLTFLTPPVRRSQDPATPDPKYQAVYDLLDDTVFVSLDRRQLLATSREIEDRAWRTGHGRLHAGFQSVDAFDAQADNYRELARTTDIDIHVYTQQAISVDRFGDIPLTTHTDPIEEITKYWFVLFDDGDDGQQNCALVAREVSDGRFRGFWTYDPALVDQAFEAVD